MRYVIALVLLLPFPAQAETLETLLTTLHRAQDALALEGEAARPVHDRLIQMLDERLAQRGPHATGSVVAYALSGGDPRVAARALASVEQTARNAILVRGVLAYVSGRTAEAGRLLALIKPERLRGRLGSLVAMAQAGTAVRTNETQAAERLWNRVRLDAPGTLLEEAALRRLIETALGREDADRFFGLLLRYWRRYPRSAFRGRVALAMQRGVATFSEEAVLQHLPRMASALPDRELAALYDHVARAALLDGRSRLATVAARRKGKRETPHRSALLKDLARLTGKDVTRVRARLDAMPLAPLSALDRRLLLAARAVGRAITAPASYKIDGFTLEGDLTRRHRAALDAVDKLLVAR